MELAHKLGHLTSRIRRVAYRAGVSLMRLMKMLTKQLTWGWRAVRWAIGTLVAAIFGIWLAAKLSEQRIDIQVVAYDPSQFERPIVFRIDNKGRSPIENVAIRYTFCLAPLFAESIEATAFDTTCKFTERESPITISVSCGFLNPQSTFTAGFFQDAEGVADYDTVFVEIAAPGLEKRLECNFEGGTESLKSLAESLERGELNQDEYQQEVAKYCKPATRQVWCG